MQDCWESHLLEHECGGSWGGCWRPLEGQRQREARSDPRLFTWRGAGDQEEGRSLCALLQTLRTPPYPGGIKLEPGGKGGSGNVDSRAAGGLEEERGAEDP